MLPLQSQATGPYGPRSVLFMLALLVGLFSMAQPDGLARDFEKLSAKERARIAKQEQDAAGKDPEYQAVMEAAEALFQGGQYEASMEKFKEARTMRPYNVYPKVKIQDLQALILKRDAEEAAATRPEPTIKPAPTVEPPMEVTPVPLKVEPEIRVVAQPVRARPTPVGTDRGRTGKAPPEKVQVQPKPVALEGQKDGEEGQRVYKEGRSVVVESRVTEEGRLVIYRKVSHPWGAVDHFREGVAISDRAYQQAMSDR
ncbi:MAG TPA: hypothetical protein PLV08_02520 [Flavobacteriales bacterium]|nr:hypothetical protein [Flavobacteriales bacterium]MBK6551107.1 hypothetical protein [Flavobacteriales bacterium]MBK7482175.1 hypothetical protein [Flavobacteriales bacterium]MBK8532012.1 hypothetical protein [Flavobacteriales bacterium]MBP8877401.1 hypothetical protein [Flavobacteriales bacterium]